MTQTELATVALERAQSGQSVSNYPAIFTYFLAAGIPEDEIKPRENVLTFHAWKALGRSVRKGEHGCRVATIRQTSKEDPDTGEITTRKSPWYSTVFHISQTEVR